MSADIEGLVETSLNLGVLALTSEQLSMRYAVRSSVGTAKEFLKDKIAHLVAYMGGTITCKGEYPALRLILVLTCLSQTKMWKAKDIEHYDQIKRCADKVVYTSQ